MKKAGFFTNKYTISVIILLACLVTDIALHRRMSRAIIPSAFTDKRKAQTFAECKADLISKGKHWLKDVSTADAMQQVPAETNGLQWNVYFDTASANLKIRGDGASLASISIDSLLSIYHSRQLNASLWFDITNVDSADQKKTLVQVGQITKRYNLSSKIIITSTAPEELISYCDSGFFTGYRIPDLNPYSLKEDSLIHYLDIIAANLKAYAVSAIACNYLQYPVVKKYFPDLPVLTWTDRSNISLVSRLFNLHLENDAQIKVVLYPYQ